MTELIIYNAILTVVLIGIALYQKLKKKPSNKPTMDDKERLKVEELKRGYENINMYNKDQAIKKVR